MGKQVAVVLYVVAMAAVIVGVDFDCLDRNGNGEIHLTDLTQASACVDDAGKRLIQTAAHNGYAQRQQLAQARISSNRH
jgi:hypothetical protein